MDARTICIAVDTDDPAVLAKVSEQFARTLAGLSMEEVYGTIYIFDPMDEESDE